MKTWGLLVTAVLVILLPASYRTFAQIAEPLLGLIAVILLPIPLLVLITWFSQLLAMSDWLGVRMALASNEPLQRMLNQHIDPEVIQALQHPVYVTLSMLQRTQPAGLVPGLPMPSRLEFVPDYYDVRQATPALMRELVLQSAGLPEIFAVRKIEDRNYYDGGLVDNNPVLPVARTKNTIVIAIALSSDVTKEQLLANRLENERRLRETPARTRELHLLHPLEAAQVYEASFGLIAIIPSHDLGNFLRGTLGFYARRARALMQLGYFDTYRALAKEDAIGEVEARGTAAPGTSPPFPVEVESPLPGTVGPAR